jgi:hypothetical protein
MLMLMLMVHHTDGSLRSDLQHAAGWLASLAFNPGPLRVEATRVSWSIRASVLSSVYRRVVPNQRPGLAAANEYDPRIPTKGACVHACAKVVAI